MTSLGHHRDPSWTRVAQTQLEITTRDDEFTSSMERSITYVITYVINHVAGKQLDTRL